MSSSTVKSTSSQSFRMSEGDWVCVDQNCGNINFARRTSCNLCGKDKPLDSRLKDKESSAAVTERSSSSERSSSADRSASAAEKKRKVGHEIGKVAAEKSKGLFSADDWQCGRCGNVNWARRSTCNMCSAPKFSETEERTGLGGGYNEREEVEYREREDSDGEYDDFGRKKKRRLNSDSDGNQKSNDRPTHSSHGKSDDNQSSDGEKDDEEDDDDESGDVSKYKLDSEEEDEDDDDDEDVDLSKYDLIEALEDDNK